MHPVRLGAGAIAGNSGRVSGNPLGSWEAAARRQGTSAALRQGPGKSRQERGKRKKRKLNIGFLKWKVATS